MTRETPPASLPRVLQRRRRRARRRRGKTQRYRHRIAVRRRGGCWIRDFALEWFRIRGHIVGKLELSCRGSSPLEVHVVHVHVLPRTRCGAAANARSGERRTGRAGCANILTVCDFQRRVQGGAAAGMSIELPPLLVGGSHHPTGQVVFRLVEDRRRQCCGRGWPNHAQHLGRLTTRHSVDDALASVEDYVSGP
jgi:hypothetical protein